MTGTVWDVRAAAVREAEHCRQQISEAAGPHAAAVGRLALEFDTLKNAESTAEAHVKLWAIGHFLCDYGAWPVWRAMWCRYAFDDRTNEGWHIAEHYVEGDELRWLYGDEWKQRRDQFTRQQRPPSGIMGID